MLGRLLYLVAVVGVIFILVGLAELVGLFTFGTAGASTFIIAGVIVLICCWVFGGVGRTRTPL